MSRIEQRFAKLKEENRAAFVSFVMAGDPTPDASAKLLKGLPAAGVDIIEIGMPFTDPMADGPAVQLAGQRALAAGQTLKGTLDMVATFRKGDDETPIVLMGYYNPIFNHGVEAFLKDAKEAGIDGLIVVDLPPEEDGELCLPAKEAGIDFIRLATPTTDDERLPAVLANTSGFIYYVSIAGITGAGSADTAAVEAAMKRIKAKTDLPVVVGFGVKTPEQGAELAKVTDGVVVGSAIIDMIVGKLDKNGKPKVGLVKNVTAFVKSLADAVHSARG